MDIPGILVKTVILPVLGQNSGFMANTSILGVILGTSYETGFYVRHRNHRNQQIPVTIL